MTQQTETDQRRDANTTTQKLRTKDQNQLNQHVTINSANHSTLPCTHSLYIIPEVSTFIAHQCVSKTLACMQT